MSEGVPNVLAPPEIRQRAFAADEAITAWLRYTIAKGPMLTCCGDRSDEPYEAVAQRFLGMVAGALKSAVMERQASEPSGPPR